MRADPASAASIQNTELTPLDERDFQFFRSAIFARAGITLSDAKRDLVQSRLRDRVLKLGHGGYPDYRAFLQSLHADHPEWQEFTNCLTTNKTDWFREPAHFDFLVNELIPRWRETAGSKTLRLWSAACATGEEPYTLSMLLHEHFGAAPHRSFEILASDVDTDVLKVASKGIYPKSALAQVPGRFHKTAFIPGTEEIAHLMKVRPALKSTITFRNLNLSQTPYPFRQKFDVIFCRNVFIYFSREVIASILDAFYAVASPDALLFIGHSESIQGCSKWNYVGPAIYSKGKWR